MHVPRVRPIREYVRLARVIAQCTVLYVKVVCCGAVTGLVLLLVLVFVWPRADGSWWLRPPLALEPVQLLQICCTLEVMFLAPFWFAYCGMIRRLHSLTQ